MLLPLFPLVPLLEVGTLGFQLAGQELDTIVILSTLISRLAIEWSWPSLLEAEPLEEALPLVEALPLMPDWPASAPTEPEAEGLEELELELDGLDDAELGLFSAVPAVPPVAPMPAPAEPMEFSSPCIFT